MQPVAFLLKPLTEVALMSTFEGLVNALAVQVGLECLFICTCGWQCRTSGI